MPPPAILPVMMFMNGPSETIRKALIKCSFLSVALVVVSSQQQKSNNIGIREWIIYYSHCCEKIPAKYLNEGIIGFGSEFKVTVQHVREDVAGA